MYQYASPPTVIRLGLEWVKLSSHEAGAVAGLGNAWATVGGSTTGAAAKLRPRATTQAADGRGQRIGVFSARVWDARGRERRARAHRACVLTITDTPPT